MDSRNSTCNPPQTSLLWISLSLSFHHSEIPAKKNLHPDHIIGADGGKRSIRKFSTSTQTAWLSNHWTMFSTARPPLLQHQTPFLPTNSTPVSSSLNPPRRSSPNYALYSMSGFSSPFSLSAISRARWTGVREDEGEHGQAQILRRRRHRLSECILPQLVRFALPNLTTHASYCVPSSSACICWYGAQRETCPMRRPALTSLSYIPAPSSSPLLDPPSSSALASIFFGAAGRGASGTRRAARAGSGSATTRCGRCNG